MKVVFETKDHGKIEVIQETRLAYFQRQDYLTDINADGEFSDWNGRVFSIIWPVSTTFPAAILQVREIREIGREVPA